MGARLARLTATCREIWRPTPEAIGLDVLLARADPREPFAERLQWLARVCRWVANPKRLRAGLAGESVEDASRCVQATRLRFLLNVLDRHPEVKTRVARAIRATLREVDALELYCESGLPREPGLWSEALERMLARLLPRNPYRADLGSVLQALFPEEEDALWLERLPEDTLARLHEAVEVDAAPDEEGWDALVRDVPDALLYLVSDLRATGLSSPIRRRLDPVPFRALPFFALTTEAERIVAAWHERDATALGTAAGTFMDRLARCRQCISQVQGHLGEFGVSLKVVYLMERMEAQVRRIQSLLELLSLEGPATARPRFLARLVRDNVARRRVRTLVADNLHLLARKLVDRSAETGEHYIARTRQEYRSMFRGAVGGGALTAVTTWIKFGVTALHLPPFLEGLLASLNYAASFVAIQLAHFTLATKQPAMTGPALAARMQGVETEEGLRGFTEEVVHLIRSQAAGIFGNVFAVAPCVLLTAGLAATVFGAPPLGPEKAQGLVSSLSLLGPTAIFAAFTGILLWSSSLLAGWADNWFALRGLRDGIAGSPRLRFLLGPGRAARFARWLDLNMSGLTGNVSLGLLLGLAPEVARFVGLPLEVRHVTLGAGQLAAATATLGPEVLRQWSFWLAVLGLAAVGALNVGVSFALALMMAVRARRVGAPLREAIRRSLLRTLRERPLSFLFPGRKAATAPAA